MFWGCAAAAANDAGARVTRERGVFGHQFRRAVIVDMSVVIFGDTRIAFGNDMFWRLAKTKHSAQEI